MKLLRRYIDSWVQNDPDSVVDCLADDCVLIECHGATYTSRLEISDWAHAWFAAGGIVHRWEIVDHFVAPGREVAQWDFECTWEGNRTRFEGATIARVVNSQIINLREYETSGNRYFVKS